MGVTTRSSRRRHEPRLLPRSPGSSSHPDGTASERPTTQTTGVSTTVVVSTEGGRASADGRSGTKGAAGTRTSGHGGGRSRKRPRRTAATGGSSDAPAPGAEGTAGVRRAGEDDDGRSDTRPRTIADGQTVRRPSRTAKKGAGAERNPNQNALETDPKTGIGTKRTVQKKTERKKNAPPKTSAAATIKRRLSTRKRAPPSTHAPNTPVSDASAPLLTLPSGCVKATFLCRPSKRNRSPYVADIFVPSLAREAVCHVPNLDMGGKCRKGVTLLVKPQKDKKGNPIGPDAVSPKYDTPKCEFAAQLVYVDESDLHPDYVPTWVAAHPSLGEALAKQILLRHLSGTTPIPGIGAFSRLSEQVTTREGTRSDFVLGWNEGEEEEGKKKGTTKRRRERIVEVKTVVDTDYSTHGTLPDSAHTKCLFTSDETPYRRKGLFPWGRSKQKGPDGEPVVSARAIKHVRELTDSVRRGARDGTVLFVVARGDAEVFRPNVGACPSFARYLREANDMGVQVLVKRVRWVDGSGSGGGAGGGGRRLGECFDDGWLDIEWS